MLNAIVTEIPPKPEPATEDSFIDVAVSDRPGETTAHRIAELFASEQRRAIVDYLPVSATVKPPPTATVDLYWIPLGAGGHSVRFNGRVFEAIQAARDHRPRCDLYHAALVVALDGDRHTIELAPSPNADAASRGVVATGVVGSRHAGRLRLFRYEVRCWRGGSIPDLGEAVGGPRRLSSDPQLARRLLELVPSVPTPVWGRDELKAGEMWNSNSLISWLIATAGLSTDLARPPLTAPLLDLIRCAGDARTRSRRAVRRS
jgi:hypothetical protein